MNNDWIPPADPLPWQIPNQTPFAPMTGARPADPIDSLRKSWDRPLVGFLATLGSSASLLRAELAPLGGREVSGFSYATSESLKER